MLASSTGVTFNSEYYTPELTNIASDIRFVANEDTWDSQAGTWSAFSTNDPVAYASSPPSSAPVLTEVEVLNGQRLLRRVSALSVNQGTRLRLSLGRGTVGRTISMVIDPSSSYWTIPILRTAGDVQPGQVTSIEYTDKFDFLWNGTGASVDPVAPLAKMSPVYLTLRILPPVVTLFVSYDFNKHFSASQASRAGIATTSMEFDVGAAESHRDFSFRLFEVNVWDDPLEDGEIVSNHQRLMSIYGVNDAWS